VQIPTLVLNVTHPLVPEEISGFCAGKRAVLLIEEGSPERFFSDPQHERTKVFLSQIL
jgi:TPP-dependent indolepyruvate ferredoxin oxidoreductase alpha subunit